jgi:hypothetical protein
MRPKALFALIAVLALGVAASGCFSSTPANRTITQAVTLGTGTSATVVQPSSSSGATTTGGGQTTASGTGTGTGTATSTGGGGGQPAAQTLGVSGLPCAGCHTLKDAGWAGNVGPNLDDAKPAFSLVVDRVTNGKGAMPSFKGQLSDQQIADVASYVVKATGGTP